MKKLSPEQYHRACEYIKQYARPIDQSLFEYHFENGSNKKVVKNLEAFQNEDGGIGHGLEPDIRSSQSSPIATSVAMQYAREANLSWREPLIKSVMNYFTEIYEPNKKWPLKQVHMNTEPHADWWHYTQEGDKFQVNPGAEIIGYYHAYPQTIPVDLLPLFHDQIFQHLESQTSCVEYHEALCFLRLANEIPDPGKTMIIEFLREWARNIVTLDPNRWDNYSAKPIWLAPHPYSPLYNALEDVICLNLDYEINQQQEDGSWVPNWEWGKYRSFWESTAKQEWQGYLTVKTLKVLKDYERIDYI
ncbi:hypothetical protein ACERII_13900 [Evansella sp. AB-rgal1]|uniref:hypothetical protein n=1 Tax=Evansella sp. AB-rgal1 TaxID=3242696 RepID=UPI00359E6362